MSKRTIVHEPSGTPATRQKINTLARDHQLVLIRPPKLYGCACGAVWPGDKKRAKWHQDCHVATLQERTEQLADTHSRGMGDFTPEDFKP